MNVGAATEALLADARDDAADVRAAAEAETEAILEAARREAAETIALARAQGEAEARRAAGSDEALARTLARMEVLAAQRQAYDELWGRARSAALALRDDPDYPQLLARLIAAARRDLGEAAQLEIDPEGAGGVRARAGSRRVDYTLDALVVRCVAALGPSLRRLWE